MTEAQTLVLPVATEAVAEAVTGTKPEIPLQETPEFRKAVEEAVVSMVPALVAQLSAARGEPASGDQAFAEKLAMAISELSDQGTGRKRVAPEIIEQRAKARTRMAELIVEARAAGLAPTYQLVNKVYLDEVLVDPIYMDPATKAARPVEIDWPGVPNQAMSPVNDVAKGIHAAFMESIGSVVSAAGVSHALPGPDRLGVTPNGLVVRNGAVQQRREIGSLGTQPSGGEGLRLHHKEAAPTVHKEIRVLGTVAAPARVGAA